MIEIRRGATRRFAQVKELAIRAPHDIFWGVAEKQLNHLKNGEFVTNTRLITVTSGSDGGQLEIVTPQLDGMKESKLTVGYSRDEWDGHLTYLNARRTLTDFLTTEQTIGRLAALPSEFEVVGINPIIVLAGLHAAAVAGREQDQ